MGAFFTNVQVHCADVATVEAALTESLLAEGFELAEDSASANRSIAIAVHGDWIAVYDEATDQLEASVDALAELLSRAANGFAVTTMVHDSDVAMLGLYRSGEPVDDVMTNPGFFDDVDEGREDDDEEQNSGGDPEQWKPLLVSGATTEQLRAAWDNEQTFAEDVVGETASLLGWNEEAAVLGFNSLIDVELELRWLRFYSEESAREAIPVDGPPAFYDAARDDRLTPTSYHGMVRPRAFDDCMLTGIELLSRGGPGRGIEITVSGSLFDDELVLLEKIEIQIGTYKNTIAPERLDQPDGARVYRGGDPEVPIPQCTDPDGFDPAQSVMVSVWGRHLKLGQGDVVIRGEPIENPQGFTEQRGGYAIVKDVTAFLAKMI